MNKRIIITLIIAASLLLTGAGMLASVLSVDDQSVETTTTIVNEEPVVIITSPSTTTSTEAPTTTTTLVPDRSNLIETETLEVPQPWPVVGKPVKLVIDGLVACRVYDTAHAPDGWFNPKSGQIGYWTGQGYSAPGEEGFSFLAGHVTDCFKEIAEKAVPGTEVLIEDDNGNVITLVVTWEPRRFHKQQVPWADVIRGTVEDGQSVTWLFTCGGTERRADGHRVYNDAVRTELVKIDLATGETWYAPEMPTVPEGAK